ncbi:MAG: hypothetical protein HY735_35820 [Verrucomicrobia bacterium]|nr:hypothetical protein [Verrucomicrobiota bacterium]
MTARRFVKGSALSLIGFLLSPISWWNDLFVNVPLALVFAWTVSLLFPQAFLGSFVLGYWMTNVLGLILMHRGAQILLNGGSTAFDRKNLLKQLIISLFYTAVVLLLAKLKIAQPLPGYFVPS